MSVRLRKMTVDDAGLVVRWRNNNAPFFPPRLDPLTRNEHLRWFHSVYEYDPADHYYIVCEGYAPVGTIAFNSRTCEIGRVMLGAKSFERKGVMSEALDQLVKAFHSNHRYSLKVLETNTAAIAFYRRNYFVPFRNNYGPEGDGDFVYMERWVD